MGKDDFMLWDLLVRWWCKNVKKKEKEPLDSQGVGWSGKRLAIEALDMG